MTPENIIWKSFLGEAPQREFDPNRYVNWRFFWDYSGGNVYENMCHQCRFWYKVMKLQIPKVGEHGGRRLPVEGRPRSAGHDECRHGAAGRDPVHLGSGFGNRPARRHRRRLGDRRDHLQGQQIRYTPQKVNRPDGTEMVGATRHRPSAHMQNFLDCIRSACKRPIVRSTSASAFPIACRMAVESYRQGRTMRWDAANEEIV